MPLLKAEAEKLSQEDMIRGVIEEFIDQEELFALLSFVGTSGKSYDYNREKTLATGDWLNPNENVNESASEFDEVSTRLRILIGDVDVDKFIDGTMSDVNSQKAIQIQSKVKGMRNQYKDALINGQQANKQFDGLQALVHADQVLDGGNLAMDLGMLDELTAAVKTGADVIMMRPEHYRKYKQIMRTFGGNTGGMIQLENFGRPVLAHDGCPIIVNEYIKKTQIDASEDYKSDIFAIHLDEANGVHGLFAKQHAAGFDIEDIGTVQNKDATRTRIKMYTGLALKSTLSLAKIKDVKIG
ncbi:phage major capsid protein [Vibrio parahaemolyticus]|nr:phage major capsid protein [Vibrio parahaemolyticus]EHK6545854.1 phage major capsid protein [Vibrio parahaemolyticus]EKN4564987.1 phage major capsid protein [Vibrio parahaemolyticus]ELJ1804503.1 phage major capsid protein [Vibrio parahaemolyticus]